MKAVANIVRSRSAEVAFIFYLYIWRKRFIKKSLRIPHLVVREIFWESFNHTRNTSHSTFSDLHNQDIVQERETLPSIFCSSGPINQQWGALFSLGKEGTMLVEMGLEWRFKTSFLEDFDYSTLDTLGGVLLVSSKVLFERLADIVGSSCSVSSVRAVGRRRGMQLHSFGKWQSSVRAVGSHRGRQWWRGDGGGRVSSDFKRLLRWRRDCRGRCSGAGLWISGEGACGRMQSSSC